MLAKERQDRIYKWIKKEGAVTTLALVEKFRVSDETIRRDLLYMENQKLLERVHGGAVAVGEIKPYRDFGYRREENSDNKRALSKLAVDFIEEGDIIGIDTGSTAIHLAEAIKERFSELTVVTYSVDVLRILGGYKNIRVIVCGGIYFPEENCFHGEPVEDMLGKLHMNKVFIFPYAVFMKNGVCDHTYNLYPLQKKLLECASEIFILGDSSKFEKNALYKVCEMKKEFVYITDENLSDELKNLYKENEFRVITE